MNHPTTLENQKRSSVWGAAGLAWLCGALALLGACDEDPLDGAVAQPISIAFAAVVGDEPFACGEAYTVGTTDSTFVGSDFRLYLHDLVAFAPDGTEHPLTLDATSPWQTASVALLDFEDGSASCLNGSSLMNAEVTGLTTASEVVGVGFTVGVPQTLNHANQALAESPLNLTSMFWSWANGYKFVRIDGETTGLGNSFRFHLGSTGCERNDQGETACSRPNRAVIRLEDFDPSEEIVVVDLAAMFANSDVDNNDGDSAPGCMSELDDDDCDPLYEAFGLDRATGRPAGAQRVFRALSSN